MEKTSLRCARVRRTSPKGLKADASRRVWLASGPPPRLTIDKPSRGSCPPSPPPCALLEPGFPSRASPAAPVGHDRARSASFTAGAASSPPRAYVHQLPQSVAHRARAARHPPRVRGVGGGARAAPGDVTPIAQPPRYVRSAIFGSAGGPGCIDRARRRCDREGPLMGP